MVTPKKAIRYVAANGSPYSDKDAAVIGRELVRIAEENKIENISSLDKHIVFAHAKRRDSVLHSFVFNKSTSEAAEAYFIDQCSKMIRSIRVIAVTVGKLETREPLFITA